MKAILKLNAAANVIFVTLTVFFVTRLLGVCGNRTWRNSCDAVLNAYSSAAEKGLEALKK